MVAFPSRRATRASQGCCDGQMTDARRLGHKIGENSQERQPEFRVQAEKKEEEEEEEKEGRRGRRKKEGRYMRRNK